MQENPKADGIVPDEVRHDDIQRRQTDDMRKKYVGNGMAVGMCAGMAGGIIFIARYGLTAVGIGALIGAVLGARIGMSVFKHRQRR